MPLLAVSATGLPCAQSGYCNCLFGDHGWCCARGLHKSRANAAGVVPRGLFLEKPSPLSFAKAIKNEAELDGMREAHLRDAVALAETLYHLEQEVSAAPPHVMHCMPGTSERIKGKRYRGADGCHSE